MNQTAFSDMICVVHHHERNEYYSTNMRVSVNPLEWKLHPDFRPCPPLLQSCFKLEYATLLLSSKTFSWRISITSLTTGERVRNCTRGVAWILETGSNVYNAREACAEILHTGTTPVN